MARLKQAAVLVAGIHHEEEMIRRYPVENVEIKRTSGVKAYFSPLGNWGLDRFFVQIHDVNVSPRVVAFLDAEATWTVGHLKEKLVVLDGINARLVYKGEELTDHRTLLSYGIDDSDHTVYAIRDLRLEPRDAAP